MQVLNNPKLNKVNNPHPQTAHMAIVEQGTILRVKPPEILVYLVIGTDGVTGDISKRTDKDKREDKNYIQTD